MDQVFRDLPFAFVYLDDILVASRDESEHKQHLWEVLGKLCDNGMAVNASKCVLGQSSVKYLGQEISAEGVRPLPSKLQSVGSDTGRHPQSKNSKNKRRLFSMSNGGRLKTFILNFVITTKTNPDRLSPIRAIATLAAFLHCSSYYLVYTSQLSHAYM